jgi:hypothetical protein
MVSALMPTSYGECNMGRKVDRIWGNSSEAIALLAEHPDYSAAQTVAALFNGTADGVTKEANALQAGVLARKKADAARLAAEIAATEKRVSATAKTA